MKNETNHEPRRENNHHPPEQRTVDYAETLRGESVSNQTDAGIQQIRERKIEMNWAIVLDVFVICYVGYLAQDDFKKNKRIFAWIEVGFVILWTVYLIKEVATLL